MKNYEETLREITKNLKNNGKIEINKKNDNDYWIKVMTCLENEKKETIKIITIIEKKEEKRENKSEF